MSTIEETAVVGPDGRVVLMLPASVTPGPHRVVLMVEETAPEPSGDDPLAGLIAAFSGGPGTTGRDAEEVLYGPSREK
ncbi:MAG: hypothetical protein ABIZ56_00820 [Chthoniobacteraceae bacterium]